MAGLKKIGITLPMGCYTIQTTVKVKEFFKAALG
jgi:hypothetical protein